MGEVTEVHALNCIILLNLKRRARMSLKEERPRYIVSATDDFHCCHCTGQLSWAGTHLSTLRKSQYLEKVVSLGGVLPAILVWVKGIESSPGEDLQERSPGHLLGWHHHFH